MKIPFILFFSILISLPVFADECAKTIEQLEKIAGGNIPESWVEHQQKDPDGKPLRMTLEDRGDDDGMLITITKQHLSTTEIVKWINRATVEVCKGPKGFYISFPDGKPKLDNRCFDGMAGFAIKMGLGKTIKIDTLNSNTLSMNPGFPILFKPD